MKKAFGPFVNRVARNFNPKHQIGAEIPRRLSAGETHAFGIRIIPRVFLILPRVVGCAGSLVCRPQGDRASTFQPASMAPPTPCPTLALQAQFGLSLFQEGLLGSLVYLGLTSTCLVAGSVLSSFSPKRVLGVALLANCVWCLLFSASTSMYFLFFSRFMVGVSQSFIVIFSPVWVSPCACACATVSWSSALCRKGT